jgi:hypothetical protein
MMAAQTDCGESATENHILFSRFTVSVSFIIDISAVTTGTEYFAINIHFVASWELVPR